MDYIFINIDKMVSLIMAGNEMGFTSDTRESIQVYGEPIGWFGAKLSHEFDGNALIIGEYGIGIITSEEIHDSRDVKYALRRFFKHEFLSIPKEICVDAEDYRKAEGRK